MKQIIEKYEKELEEAQKILNLPHDKEYEIQILERISNLKTFIYELKKVQELRDQEQAVMHCMEPHCMNPATKDYNGHNHFVCDYHYEKLNDYFDEEYD